MPDVPATEEFCPRQIVFTIDGNPAIQVTATENGGSIDFSIELVGEGPVSGDIRGLFFDFADEHLSGLSLTSDDPNLAEARIDPDSVLNLGNGANLIGKTNMGFDVGLEWGSAGIGHGDMLTGPLTFTLSNADASLTLDDIAHQRFGGVVSSFGGPSMHAASHKVITIAPAAPDAMDDSFQIYEDGASGLGDPSKLPTDVVLNVLANDFDGDGDPLTITEIHEQPAHGTVSIAPDGQTLIYTPELDYAGSIMFEYCVSDGNGGQDHAVVTLDIVAVADDPIVTWTVEQGTTINEMIITVTATQDDADGSEYVDSILASVAGGMPAGASLAPGGVNPAGQPGQLVQQFVLTTADDMSYDFDLDFTAVAREVSNGDAEANTATVGVVIDYQSVTQQGVFEANDQSIWSNGDAFVFVDDRFVGVDTGPFNPEIGGAIYAGIEGDIQLGFQSTLVFEGGSIDATTDYDLTVETTYNRTTDWLQVETGSLLTDAFFQTIGPEGSYTLDFIWDIMLRAYAGIDLTVLEVGIDEEINLLNIDTGPGSLNLIDLDSATLSGTIDFPPPLDAFSVDFAWPHIATSGGYPLPIEGSGASNNFLQLNLDVDQLVSQILFGGVNPFDPPRLEAGPFYADADLLDVDVSAGLNFLQDFLVTLGDVAGLIVFEDGSSQSFTFGDDLFFGDASLIDQAGDNDGLVEFTFYVGPDATLHNETSLGINVGVDISLLEVELGYDIEIASDSITLGPLAEFGTVEPVADITVFDSTFGLDFAAQDFAFYA